MNKDQRLTERKSHINQSNDEPIIYTEDKPVILSSHGICYGIIILFSEYENHNTIIAQDHIKTFII